MPQNQFTAYLTPSIPNFNTKVANSTPSILPTKKTTQPTPSPTPATPSATPSSAVVKQATPSPVANAKADYISSVASTSPGVYTSATPNPVPITGNTTTPSGATVNADTGNLVKAPVADPKAAYTAAYEAYIRSLMPSDSENTASKYLSDLVLQSKKDQEEALNRGETLGFASGEAARVNKNNQFAIDAASNAVNSFTSNRNAMSDAAKARVEFEKSLLGDTKDNAGFTLGSGQTRYEYDPETGQYKAVGSVPRAPTAPKNPQVFGSADTGYYTLNEDGTATPIGLKPAVDWEDYLKAAQDELGMDLNPESETYKQLRQQYNSTYTRTAVGGGAEDFGL